MDLYADVHETAITSIGSGRLSMTSSIQGRRHSILGRRTGSVSRQSISQDAPASLSFHNINYIVGAQVESSLQRSRLSSLPILSALPALPPLPSFPELPFRKKPEPRQILFDLSGQFVNGMNAILGPSGCGKSSLLDVLADRKDPRGMSGLVLIDGMPRHPSFRYTVGYVVQEDICSGTLTVRENFFFSANLRMPKEVTLEQKTERVARTIIELSLESCADTRVGTEFLRGISGGERKRTCIGMELVLSPKILFLDEPTTGLDASTATTVMQCLKELSGRGRTVIFSIHQPRYSIFKLFDTAMFMSKGRCVYHGSANEVVPYFSNFGYQCETHDNPADYALDVLIDIGRKPEILQTLTNVYQTTHAEALTALRQQGTLTDSENIEHERRQYKVDAARSSRAEFYYLSQRTIRNSVRNPALALSQTVVSIIIGLLVGLMFYHLTNKDDPGISNRLGAIFFIVVSQIFSNVTALEPFLKERVLFIHEYVSGYYRIWTYFFAKFVCDLLPMRILPSFLFTIITYFMTGLAVTGRQFFIFLLTIFMANMFGAAMCFFISATISVFVVALIVVVLIFVVMMMFSGFLIDLASVFDWLSWIQWISAFRYASNVLTINEFKGLKLCLANFTNICQVTGESVLDKRGLAHAHGWDLWKHFFALTVMSIVFFVLAYIQLVRTKKTK